MDIIRYSPVCNFWQYSLKIIKWHRLLYFVKNWTWYVIPLYVIFWPYSLKTIKLRSLLNFVKMWTWYVIILYAIFWQYSLKTTKWHRLINFIKKWTLYVINFLKVPLKHYKMESFTEFCWKVDIIRYYRDPLRPTVFLNSGQMSRKWDLINKFSYSTRIIEMAN